MNVPRAVLEADVFSGRENPRGALTEAETLAFREALVQPLTNEEPPDGGLGYRGFVVDLGVPHERYRVFRGVIANESNGATRFDEGRKLERMLARCAASFVEPALAEWLLTAE